VAWIENAKNVSALETTVEVVLVSINRLGHGSRRMTTDI
jgi:hypothetical protein